LAHKTSQLGKAREQLANAGLTGKMAIKIMYVSIFVYHTCKTEVQTLTVLLGSKDAVNN